MNHHERLLKLYSLLVQRHEVEEAVLLKPLIDDIKNNNAIVIARVNGAFTLPEYLQPKIISVNIVEEK